MAISATSSSDALTYLQSLLQTAGNLAGNAAEVGPVGDWMASAGTGGSQTAGVLPPVSRPSAWRRRRSRTAQWRR